MSPESRHSLANCALVMRRPASLRRSAAGPNAPKPQKYRKHFFSVVLLSKPAGTLRYCRCEEMRPAEC